MRPAGARGHPPPGGGTAPAGRGGPPDSTTTKSAATRSVNPTRGLPLQGSAHAARNRLIDDEPLEVCGFVIVRLADLATSGPDRHRAVPVPPGVTAVIDVGDERCPEPAAVRRVAGLVTDARRVMVMGSDGRAVARLTRELPGVLARVVDEDRRCSALFGEDPF